MILYAICMVEREEEAEEGRAAPVTTLEGLQALKMYLSSMGRSDAFHKLGNWCLVFRIFRVFRILGFLGFLGFLGILRIVGSLGFSSDRLRRFRSF